MMYPAVQHPFDLEILPGKTVRQLASRDECQAALFQIENDLLTIQNQIAGAEANPASVAPGWRTRAQTAIRWKKRIRTAIVDFAKGYEPVPTPTGTKRKLILDVIKDELGADEFDRLIGIAKQRHPHAFKEAVDV